MQSVMVLKIGLGHEVGLPPADELAVMVQNGLVVRLMDEDDIVVRGITVEVVSAVIEQDGGFQITPSRELRRAIGY